VSKLGGYDLGGTTGGLCPDTILGRPNYISGHKA